jgi:hypothetical protein
MEETRSFGEIWHVFPLTLLNLYREVVRDYELITEHMENYFYADYPLE